ncbi:hypothetical protein DUI87_17762 [Hirundo rustica rustica]|uniref:Uncharacterized protein n=1 Tax=Hirundo rustica rustica TaxID=333673 RepID=A0A3M0KES3_HIRRU|nr:hypothetical protein DUI87_17762 [Hirundo rustica rustica]
MIVSQVALNQYPEQAKVCPVKFQEQRFKQKPREPLPVVRDDDVIDEDHEMSITEEDIIRITASEGIPARRVKALEFTRQASSFLLSEDFMNKFFRRFTETAFRHDPTSSFSQIFLPGKEVSKKFEDAQQALIPVQRVKEKEKVKEKETEKEKEKETEKETKPKEVKPPKQVGPERKKKQQRKQPKQRKQFQRQAPHRLLPSQNLVQQTGQT